jgi:histone deacetylase HOS2
MTTSLGGCPSIWEDPVIQEWQVPGEYVGLNYWRGMTQAGRDAVIEYEADANGIERPQGHTVSFHYNARVEGHHFGSKHPMKPYRLTLTKQLILSYGLQFAMDLYESRMATQEEIAAFHNPDYLEFLRKLDPRIHDMGEMARKGDPDVLKFIGPDYAAADCPAWDNMWNYVRYYSGASLDGARSLVADQSDIAINWSGGLHHAHKSRAAGFCYINDIVLAIQQLLLVHPRVLYIDIDVHHGDGVEEAFFSTDRVMTLSFHNYAETFFPGTGSTDDVGPKDRNNPGAHHSLNVPYAQGIVDQQWIRVFEAVMGPTIDTFDPSAIVLQCGADSLGGDRLGHFNVNVKAHGHCVQYVKSRCHNRKLLILGGGGYTPRNVARCWTHETALCADVQLRPTIPEHVPYRQAFMGAEHGDGELYPNFDDVQKTFHPNHNKDSELDRLIENVHTQLRYIQGAPSVQMQYIPNDYIRLREEEDARMKDEFDDDNIDEMRRDRERNIGARHEQREL